MDDHEMRSFVADAHATIRAEEEIESTVAALLQSPFDPQCQHRLATLMTSPQIAAANEAAARLAKDAEDV